MKSDSALSASSTTTTLKKEGNSKDKRQQQGLVERKNLTYFIHWCLSLARNRCDLVSPSSPFFWALLPSGVRVCHGLVAFPALHACESRVRQRATSTDLTAQQHNTPPPFKVLDCRLSKIKVRVFINLAVPHLQRDCSTSLCSMAAMAGVGARAHNQQHRQLPRARTQV